VHAVEVPRLPASRLPVSSTRGQARKSRAPGPEVPAAARRAWPRRLTSIAGP